MSEEWSIRQEEERDFQAVETMVKKAFASLDISDHQEHNLVRRLRKSEGFVSGLSLIAESDKQIIGYILLTEISIKTKEDELLALSLAPVAVDPDFQNRGVGASLIREAHQRAKKMGYFLIVLVGHEDYYPRFGYELAEACNLTFEFEVPRENGFVLNLSESPQRVLDGKVVYPKVFFEDQSPG